MSTSQNPILISGAGLASLLFAQSLLRSKIPFIIFERDESIHFRGQGYRLRLSDHGMEAIKSVLEDDYDAFYEICGETRGSGPQLLNALTGHPVDGGLKEDIVSKGSTTVGISRGDMRRFFMRGCEDYVQWGKTVKSYELAEDGVYAVFADGTKSVKGQLLVGGDGVYSSIAKQVSGGRLKVYDTGARGIHGQAPTTAFKELGEGVFFIRECLSDGRTVAIVTNVRSSDKDDPSLEFGFTFIASPGIIKAPGDNYALIGRPAADLAKDLTKDWNPRFRTFVDQINEAQAAFWKITCSTATGVPEWENQPRVTVIGDAVHSMTPAGGIGANTAVRDSALLGRLIRERGGCYEGVTAEYEKAMRVYASEAVGISYGTASRDWKVGPLVDEL